MKTVHFQIPFQSIGGTNYRIDIYAEGSVSAPEILTGADDVFSTEEDRSDDFFTPVRSQTGTLRIVDPDGTLMERIMPVNNTDRPVRLINQKTGAIEWQGFLSCEAYSQQYTSRPQEITINVNSMLEAMKSINIELSDEVQFNSLAALLFYSLRSIEQKAGIGELFDNVHIASDQLGLLTAAYIFSNPFFEERSIVNGESTIYEYVGNSCRDVVDRISAFCGCVIREYSKELYFTECSNKTRYFRITWDQAKQMIDAPYSATFPEEAVSIEKMQHLNWMGDAHNKTIMSGAKRVSVTANVDRYGGLISLPKIPFDNLVEYSPMLGSYRTYSMINTVEPLDSRSQCYAFNALYTMIKSQQQDSGQRIWVWDSVNFQVQGQSPILAYADSILSKGSSLPIAQKYAAANNTSSSAGISQSMSIGAYFAKTEIYTGDEKAFHDTKDCLVISGCCTDDGRTRSYQQNTSPLFNIRPTAMFSTIGGWLNIKISSDFIKGSGAYGVQDGEEVRMTFGLKFGSLYWNGTQWVTSGAIPRFQIPIKNGVVKTNHSDEMDTDEKDGWFIPLLDMLMVGEVRLYIFYEMSGSSVWYALINRLTLDYIPTRTNTMNDRSSNEYSDITGAPFSDEKSISLSFASDAHNVTSPTIIRTQSGVALSKTEIGDKYEHPEEYLIELMKDYYKSPRRILSLETELRKQNLPAVRFVGFDRRQYAPLSETRDWQYDKSTIQCFEIPQ